MIPDPAYRLRSGNSEFRTTAPPQAAVYHEIADTFDFDPDPPQAPADDWWNAPQQHATGPSPVLRPGTVNEASLRLHWGLAPHPIRLAHPAGAPGPATLAAGASPSYQNLS